jgi:HEAT repeat protein
MYTLKYLSPFCLLVAAAGCGKPPTADLAARARTGDTTGRIQAVHGLREKTGEKDAVVPVLVEKLKDENVYVRRDAARALGHFGPDARDAVPQLRALLRDREASVRRAATQALAKIDPTAVAAARRG